MIGLVMAGGRGSRMEFSAPEKLLLEYEKPIIFHVIDSLNDYDEIIVIGSGKGVVSVSAIIKPHWKRKSLKNYRILSKVYQHAITNCPRYNG